ncbi:MAG: hypothetical protein HFI75_14330 [Lachnospiraceae bacterium]|nr:hypothetical protein [Lachnospiraceae bacterium]
MEDGREAIYQSVINCVRDNNLQMLQFKINRLKSIAGYKNASQLLEECYKKTRSVKRRMRMKKVIHGMLTVLDFALIIGVIVLCIFLLRR